jgi:phenylacetate-CoA ligase
MIDIKRWVYDHSPIFFQNFMCTQAGKMRLRQRYDKNFQDRRLNFRKLGKQSLEEIEKYQFKELKELLRHCYETVPFYKELFQKHSFNPDLFKSFDDLKKLPTISKDDVHRAREKLISNKFDIKDLIISYSGGSTGMPTVCWHNRESLLEVYAHFWECHRPGVEPNDKYATFQGMVLIPKSQKGKPYWRMNNAMHQRLYSIYHLSLDTIENYLDDLDNYKPVYMAGYSNSLYLLAQLIKEKGLIPNWHPKAVFVTSEQLLDNYRKTIEDVFKTKVWNAYSQDEHCGSISQYECGYYHYDRAYGYIEFEDKETLISGRKVAEIICTGFLNKVYPFVRYRIGDMVEYEDVKKCPLCGRAGPIIHEIRGRTGDVILTSNGKYFPHISLLAKNLHGIRQVQLVQNAIDEITIRYVPSEDFREGQDDKLILKSFNDALDAKVKWTLEQMVEIPLTSNGKFMSIISNLKK